MSAIAFFRALKNKNKAEYIVTAHHADDQVETVLMNIVRGCGMEGLAGMMEIDGDLWRPLLPYSKQEIMDYCRERKLKFIQDETNNELHFRRNLLRAKVVPTLKELNPNFLGTMRGNIRLWQQVSAYLQKRASNFLDKQEMGPGRYSLKLFLKLDELDQQVVLRMIFEKLHGHKNNLQQDHLEQVLKVLRTNVTGKQKEFGPGKILVRGKGYFEVRGA